MTASVENHNQDEHMEDKEEVVKEEVEKPRSFVFSESMTDEFIS